MATTNNTQNKAGAGSAQQKTEKCIYIDPQALRMRKDINCDYLTTEGQRGMSGDIVITSEAVRNKFTYNKFPLNAKIAINNLVQGIDDNAPAVVSEDDVGAIRVYLIPLGITEAQKPASSPKTGETRNFYMNVMMVGEVNRQFYLLAFLNPDSAYWYTQFQVFEDQETKMMNTVKFCNPFGLPAMDIDEAYLRHVFRPVSVNGKGTFGRPTLSFCKLMKSIITDLGEGFVEGGEPDDSVVKEALDILDLYINNPRTCAPEFYPKAKAQAPASTNAEAPKTSANSMQAFFAKKMKKA